MPSKPTLVGSLKAELVLGIWSDVSGDWTVSACCIDLSLVSLCSGHGPLRAKVTRYFVCVSQKLSNISSQVAAFQLIMVHTTLR